MEDKENKPKLLSCMIKGPAPIYKLQTLVGYEGHCLSRPRGPAYTIRPRTKLHVPSIGPGPQYNVSKLTIYGADNPPAYTIVGREPFKVSDFGPGPGAHYPELCPPMNHNIRAPAYTIKSRSRTKLDDSGPGPSAYILPTTIGPKIPDKTAQGAFSIAGIHKLREEDIGPGPAAYSNIDANLTKRSSPAYSLKWRTGLPDIDKSPGPQYYPQYDTGRRPPMYSFGIRHSECAGLPITGLDED
ncbi:outer dense fiber protein 3-like [Bombus affinis]|uniref:outer dense fiber protein 3-like n=1 Tax=Bombus affinis TaxID=309941 RepID=UPI0021B81410|nr:outer dense fiber protein 3-like [Bombus affinis]